MKKAWGDRSSGSVYGPETVLFSLFLAKGWQMMAQDLSPHRIAPDCPRGLIRMETKTMKIEKVYNWLSKSVFQPQELGNPVSFEIVKFTETQSAKGPNRRLLLKHKNAKQYQCDIFGDTLNDLIDYLGDDTDLWTGKKVSVMLVKRGDKDIKQFKLEWASWWLCCCISFDDLCFVESY